MEGMRMWGRLRRRRGSDIAEAISRINEAVITLEKRRRILLGLMKNLMDRRDSLKSRIAAAKAGNDRERLAVHVTEYKDVVAMTKFLEGVELSLEKAVLRLENFRYYLIIRSEVATALSAIREVSEILEEVPGSLSNIAEEIGDTLAWLNGELSLPEDKGVDVLSFIGDKFEVQDIIDQAVDEVSEIVMRKFEAPEDREEALKILEAAKDVKSDELNELLVGVMRGGPSEEDQEDELTT